VSLPLQAVDRLFERLVATYGRQFVNLYDGIDMNAVKSTWAHELSGYAHSLKAIAWALENLPDRAPNAIVFRSLCRQAPATEPPFLPSPKLDMARVATELSKLGALKANLSQKPVPGRLDWAHRLKAKDQVDPRSVTQAVRALYRAALGQLD
jgi:hypothetical protein